MVAVRARTSTRTDDGGRLEPARAGVRAGRGVRSDLRRPGAGEALLPGALGHFGCGPVPDGGLFAPGNSYRTQKARPPALRRSLQAPASAPAPASAFPPAPAPASAPTPAPASAPAPALAPAPASPAAPAPALAPASAPALAHSSPAAPAPAGAPALAPPWPPAPAFRPRLSVVEEQGHPSRTGLPALPC